MTYKEGSIVETDQGIFELKGGQWQPYQETPAPPGQIKQEPTFAERTGRQLGLTGRYLAEGALGLPTMLADVPSTLLNMIPGVNVPSASQGVQALLSGLPQPETPMERMVAAPSKALAGTMSGMGAGGLLAGSTRPTTQLVGETLKAAPGVQSMGAIGGGLGSQAAAEGGFGPLGQMLGGLAGSLVPMAGYRAMPSARQTAEKMVGKAFQRDILPEEGAQLTQYGPEARLIDIGGPNVRGLAQAVTAPPGQARTVATKMLEDRSKASARRLISDAKKFAGTDKEAFQTTKQILTERKALAEPLYKEANRQLVQADDDIMSLMNRPAMKEAFSKGVNKAQNDPDWPADITIPRKLEQGKTVPLAALDYTKRALDDKIGAAIRKGNMDDARIYQGLKTQLTGYLDDRFPVYGQAREVFSDRSAMLNAMETGKKILRSEPDEMMEFLGDMTKSEKEMFVVGAMKTIKDRLKGQKIGGNAANKLATDLVRERIRPAFPDEDSFSSFVQGLERENVFMQSKGVLGGSPTQPRQATAGQLAGEAESIVNEPITGTLKAIRNFVFGQKQIPEKVRDEIAEILFIEQMVKPGTFSNKTVARMAGYKIPRKKLNELANSLIAVQATQEQ